MIEELKELWRFRELLVTMVQRELRIRYKNSVLGFFWSLGTPIATTVVMWFIFGQIIQNGVIKNYSAYYLCAFLPYTFLQQATLDSAQSVLGSLPIIKKVYFPRELLPIASVISNFIHLLLGFAVFFVYLTIVFLFHPGQFPLQATALYFPLLLAITFTFGLGMAFLTSALNTFYEDVKYVVSIGMYLMFFCCPVMYFVEMVANSSINRPPYILWKVYNANPFAALCIGYRKLLLAPTKVSGRNGGLYNPIPLEWNYLWFTAVLSVVLLIGGYAVFNRLKWRFVERP